MERFLGDEELYDMCFKSFLDDEAFEGLNEALEKKDYQEAFDYAHSLKGVAANLGLLPLYNSISKMVEPLREKNYVNLGEKYQEIEEEHQKLRELL